MKAGVIIIIGVCIGSCIFVLFTSSRNLNSSLWGYRGSYIDNNTFESKLSSSNNNEIDESERQRREEESAEQYIKSFKPLNILILYPDDMRHDTIGIAGTQVVQTPFLDKLAREGIRFTHNCVTTSICWISRATLFTGQYLARHLSDKLYNTHFCNNDTWVNSWPYLLQKYGGYYVGHIGKWQFHNDNFVKQVFNWTRLFEGQHWHKIDGKYIHTTDHTENMTIEFLRTRPKDRPFAATVAFYPPKGIAGKKYFNPKPTSEHLYANITIPEAYDVNGTFAQLNQHIFTRKNMGRETWYYSFGKPEWYQQNIKDIYRLITEVDEACKNIVEELKRQNILNETLVIFTTDNGMMHGEHGLAGKWFPYQESIRVPLIVWDPRIPESHRGTTDDSFTLNIDLASTILGAAKISQPDVMQGRDFADLYLRPQHIKSTWRTEFYYEHPTHMNENKIPQSSALVRKDYKYMKFDNFNVEHLFRLDIDPMELVDLMNHPLYTPKLQEMRKRYEELKNEVSQPPPYKTISYNVNATPTTTIFKNETTSTSSTTTAAKLEDTKQKSSTPNDDTNGTIAATTTTTATEGNLSLINHRFLVSSGNLVSLQQRQQQQPKSYIDTTFD